MVSAALSDSAIFRHQSVFLGSHYVKCNKKFDFKLKINGRIYTVPSKDMLMDVGNGNGECELLLIPGDYGALRLQTEKFYHAMRCLISICDLGFWILGGNCRKKVSFRSIMLANFEDYWNER